MLQCRNRRNGAMLQWIHRINFRGVSHIIFGDAKDINANFRKVSIYLNITFEVILVHRHNNEGAAERKNAVLRLMIQCLVVDSK